MNTLALRGLEEPFFISSCAVVSVFGSGGKQVCTQEYNKVVVLFSAFLVLAGNSFWCFIHMVLIVQYSCAVVSVFGSGGKSVLVLHTYLCTQSTIQLQCCVSFFGPGGKQLLTLHMYLVYNTVVQLCQFFGCGEKQFSK